MRVTSLAGIVLLVLLTALACGTALAQGAVLTSTSQEPPEHQDEAALAACKTDLRLSGSVYDSEHPERSMAVFEVPSTRASAVYKLGSRVSSFELISVVPRGVILRSADGECWLRLVGDPSGHQAYVAVKPAPAPASKPARKPKKKKAAKAAPSDPKPGAAVVIGGER